MNLQPYTFNGTAINDGTNYSSYFPTGAIMQQPDGKYNLSERVHTSPLFTYKRRSPRLLPIHIGMLGTITSQRDTLAALFDVRSEEKYKLISKDIANSNKQWYIYGTPISFTRKATEIIVTLLCDESDFIEETESTDSWAITATGQTKTITPGGNVPCYPVFQITPTAAKTSGSTRYEVYVTVYSQSDNTFTRYPLDLGEDNWDTASLIADNSNKCQINDGDGITAADTTIAYDTVTGTLPSAGMGYCGTEQFSWSGKTGTTDGNLTGCVRGINGTTAAVHADNAEIKLSHMDVDGGDIHVFIDGVESDYWLDGINTATTKLFTNIDLQPQQSMTVSGNHSDSTTTVSIANTSANKAALAALPAKGWLLWESEMVYYTGKSSGGRTLTLGGRGLKATSAAAHNDGTTCVWVEHEISIVYGDTTLTDYIVDDTRKPIFTLSSSTNTSWDYDNFLALDGNGAYTQAGWQFDKSFGTTGTAALGDPAMTTLMCYYESMNTTSPWLQLTPNSRTWSVMGGYMGYKSGYIEYLIYHPAGITHVAADGYKYTANGTWFNSDGVDKSSDGITWTNVWTDAKGSNNVKTSWSHAATDLSGTYNYIRMYLSITTAAAYYNYYDTDNMTLTIDSNEIPAVSLSTEQTPYLIDATLTNNTTAESISILYSIPLNDTLEIDTDGKTVTYLDAGMPARSAVSFSSVRFDWLHLLAAANELQWDETGAAGLTIVTDWRDRNN